MANPQNLIPQSHKLTEEEASRGGKASGEARRRKKTASELAKLMLESKVTGKRAKAVKAMCEELDDEDITVMAEMTSGQIASAIAGNTKAYEIITELAERQATKDSKPFYIPAKDIGRAFVDLNRNIDDRDYKEFWLEGGRGSIKSTYISEKVIELIKNNPRMCALIVRNVANTIKDSVFSQSKWAIDHAGLTEEFKSVSSPYEITLKGTGQKIYFRGADDPAKIKSIKPPEGMYIGIVWYEEADQLNGMETMRNINQSAIRGGDDAVLFVSYNTPKSAMHWINREKLLPKADRILHHSTYLEAPAKWLGKPFIDDAEWLRDTKPEAYKHEYLGEAVGNGSEVFDNVAIRPIAEDEIASFDNIKMGIDWGWYPDPFHWSKVHYDSARRKLYVFDEFRTNKQSNLETAEYLKEHKSVQPYDLITCDSAEKKSVADYRSYGFNARPAEKGPDSVRYGIKWLQSLIEIVIDPVRCPATADEFTKCQYEVDKEGNVTSNIPDKDNHSIDSIRYATESVWKRRGQ